MLAVIFAAALIPNTQAGSAQSDCQYGNCVTIDFGQPTLWTWIAIVVVFLVGLGIGLLVHRRRGRAPPPETDIYDTYQPKGH